MKSKLIRG